MKLIYFGKLADRQIFEEKLKEKQPFYVAQFMYESALSEELIADKDLQIDFISIYQTEYFPKNSFFINKNNKTNFIYLKFINLPFLRELSYFIDTIFQVLKWNKKNRNEHRLIYSSTHFLPVSLGIVLIGKFFNIKRIVTFTDLPLFTYSAERINKMKWYKKLIMKPYKALINFLQTQYDGYVLFTKQMNTIVNPHGKPSITIEGTFNKHGLSLKPKEKKKNVILHAGTLNKEVGIQKILDVFETISEIPIELWFVGKGDMDQSIYKAMEANKNIKHFGFLPKSEVFELMKEATLLVNLRNPNDIFTKYSFPSKMFEYMSSGTPVLTTKLNGIPDEYYDFVLSVNSYKTVDIKNEILSFFKLSDDKKVELGRNAQSFILTNKTATSQFDRLRKFIKKEI